MYIIMLFCDRIDYCLGSLMLPPSCSHTDYWRGSLILPHWVFFRAVWVTRV